ncbi:hypothetical protein [Kibdelosporangium aridum]|uniref:hypothetical protein n=1 Tax=Kibdelosporangium aridum TaxID=2030 RepID=UPI0035EA7D19
MTAEPDTVSHFRVRQQPVARHQYFIHDGRLAASATHTSHMPTVGHVLGVD